MLNRIVGDWRKTVAFMFCRKDELCMGNHYNLANNGSAILTSDVDGIHTILAPVPWHVIVCYPHPVSNDHIPILLGDRVDQPPAQPIHGLNGLGVAHPDIFWGLLAHILNGNGIVELPHMLSRAQLVQKLPRPVNGTHVPQGEDAVRRSFGRLELGAVGLAEEQVVGDWDVAVHLTAADRH